LMYKCLVQKSLYKDFYKRELGGCDLSYEFELPFVPTIGMFIQFELYKIQVENVTWDYCRSAFICSISEDDLFYNSAPLFDYALAKSDLLTNGWVVINEVIKDKNA